MIDEPGEGALSRRRMLALAGTGLAAGVAGCSSGDSDTPAATTTDGGDDEPTTEGTTNPTTTEQPPAFTVPEGGSALGYEDGFASVGDWVGDAAVYKVTEPTREALDAAVNNPEPRIVVFETSGTIDLREERFAVEFDNCWIAGQTAPSPGITLIKGGFRVNANDCVVQHLHVRPGDAGYESGWEPDSLRTADGSENNIIDHCTLTWSVDEIASPGYNSTRTTYSNCIVANALHDASHHKGPHGYGMLVGNGATEVTLAGNVFANNVRRNPRLKAETKSVLANNLIYNFAETGTRLDGSTVTAAIGNFYKQAIESDANIKGGKGFVEDNITSPDTMMTAGFTHYAGRPFWPTDLEVLDSAETEPHTLTYAGARPADRTELDAQLVTDIRNGEGQIIDSQDDVGGYPALAENTHELSVPDANRKTWLEAWAVAVEEEDVEAPSA